MSFLFPVKLNGEIISHTLEAAEAIRKGLTAADSQVRLIADRDLDPKEMGKCNMLITGSPCRIAKLDSIGTIPVCDSWITLVTPVVTDITLVSVSLSLTTIEITGRRVVSWTEGIRTAGRYIADWQGCNENGHPLSSGIYFCRMRIGIDLYAAQKIDLVK